MIPCVLCISTSFWVLRAPESWLKYFFSVVFNLFFFFKNVFQLRNRFKNSVLSYSLKLVDMQTQLIPSWYTEYEYNKTNLKDLLRESTSFKE